MLSLREVSVLLGRCGRWSVLCKPVLSDGVDMMGCMCALPNKLLPVLVNTDSCTKFVLPMLNVPNSEAWVCDKNLKYSHVTPTSKARERSHGRFFLRGLTLVAIALNLR